MKADNYLILVEKVMVRCVGGKKQGKKVWREK